MVAVHADPDVALEPPAWHARPAADALRALHVNPRVGLTSQEAAQRRAEFGPNAPASAAREPRRSALARQFVEPMPLLLVTAGFGCFALGEPLTGVAALAVSVLNAVLGLRSEGEPAHIGGAVQRLFPVDARVLRDGVAQHVHAQGLVPGDIVLVEAGEEVPADGRLLDSVTLEADESALTGERMPAVKGIDLITDVEAPLAHRTDMLFTGTRVIRGAGEFVVTATGPATEAGRIAGLLAAPGEAEAPITSGPPWLTSRVLILAGAALVVMTALGAVRGEAADSLGLAAVALTLAALPAALPAAVTVILAYATRALARVGAIVQRPPVLEALGSMSAINTDASGWLTSDRLTAVELVLPARHYTIAGTIRHVAGEPAVALEPSLLGFALSSGAAISGDGPTGDPVGGALVVLAEKGGLDVAVTRATYPRLAEVPFDAAYGLSATFHRMADASGVDVVRCFVQGAPEALLARAVTELGPDLRPLRMDARARERYLADSAELAGRGLRVVACARRDFAGPGFEVPADALTLVDGLTLLSLVGIADPPRAGAKAAVASARAAGVRVRLVTGQDAARARALATAVGIEGRVVTGAELAALGALELAPALEQIGVVARATPEQRVRLVEELRRQGHVVAVAGGGLDDVPAMRAADIGLATDAGGTDVGRAASALTCTGDVASWTGAVIAYGRGVCDDVVAVHALPVRRPGRGDPDVPRHRRAGRGGRHRIPAAPGVVRGVHDPARTGGRARRRPAP